MLIFVIGLTLTAVLVANLGYRRGRPLDLGSMSREWIHASQAAQRGSA
jgi:hypothetical protein